jgi:pimeloyl-ACP methyl ester carboxylesterase
MPNPSRGHGKRLSVESITFEATKQTKWMSPHPPARFVTVTRTSSSKCSIEGRDPPLVFLSGNGNSAHVFVISRRNSPPASCLWSPAARHGASDLTAHGGELRSRQAATTYWPRSGIETRQTGFGRPLDNWRELSSIRTRHPEKVSGLIYLDAGYGYAWRKVDLRYDRVRGHPAVYRRGHLANARDVVKTANDGRRSAKAGTALALSE